MTPQQYLTVAAKCDITTLVLGKLVKLQYGYSCESQDCGIIETYIDYLNCPTVVRAICTPVINNCSNPITTFICNFKVLSISSALPGVGDDFDISFFIPTGGLDNGLSPYTYQWEFDGGYFTIVGSSTDPILKLTLEAGKELDLLETEVSVTVTDSNGCHSTKTCWFTPAGMKCGGAFIPCPNPINLVISLP